MLFHFVYHLPDVLLLSCCHCYYFFKTLILNLLFFAQMYAVFQNHNYHLGVCFSDIFAYYFWFLLAHLTSQLCDGCRCQSVVCSLSVPWLYLETEQDRPIVSMEHYKKVGMANSVATFRPSTDPAILVSNKINFKYYYSLFFDYVQTTAVVNGARLLSHHRCRQLL